MRKNAIYTLFIFAGSIVGYYIGNRCGLSGWNWFWEIYMGAVVGFSFGFAFLNKEYDMFIGSILGLTTIFSLDYLAGSGFDLTGKLDFMALGMFTGWYFRPIWKPVLLGGFVGGIIGFVLGLRDSHPFGTLCLPPGLLNASLSFFEFFAFGMAIGSLFVKFGGLMIIDKLRHKMKLSI